MPFFIELGIMIGIIILASAIAKSIFPKEGKRLKRATRGWHDQKVHTEALQTYERLAKEKLDVIKTAIAMGYDDKELEKLDSRLEQLIGKEKLRKLGESGEVPPMSSDLMDTDLDEEIRRLRDLQKS